MSNQSKSFEVIDSKYGCWAIKCRKWNINKHVSTAQFTQHLAKIAKKAAKSVYGVDTDVDDEKEHDEELLKLTKKQGVDAKFLSSNKKLIDTTNEAWCRVTSVFNQLTAWRKGNTLGWIEKGKVMIPKGNTTEALNKIASLTSELDQAKAALQAELPGLKEAVLTGKLNHLYGEGDYPKSVEELFSIEIEPVSISPPSWLQDSYSQAAHAAQLAIEARCAEFVQKCERDLMEELKKRVAKLAEMMGRDENGDYKRFGNSTLNNIKELFGKFKSLEIGCNEDLEKILTEVNTVVEPIKPLDLRENETLRDFIGLQMNSFDKKLDTMLAQKQSRVFRIE